MKIIIQITNRMHILMSDLTDSLSVKHEDIGSREKIHIMKMFE